MSIVLVLIGINVLTFVVPYMWNFANFVYTDSFTSFLSKGWKSNPEIRDGEYYRLLTATFLHGDVIHLFFNMLSLWNVGRFVYDLPWFQGFGLITVYLLSGIMGSLFSFWFNPSVPSVGASGSIFGLVGALTAFALLSNQTALLASLFLNILVIVVYGFSSGSRIDNWGHLGGFVSGLILGAGFMYLGPVRLSF